MKFLHTSSSFWAIFESVNVLRFGYNEKIILIWYQKQQGSHQQQGPQIIRNTNNTKNSRNAMQQTAWMPTKEGTPTT